MQKIRLFRYARIIYKHIYMRKLFCDLTKHRVYFVQIADIGFYGKTLLSAPFYFRNCFSGGMATPVCSGAYCAIIGIFTAFAIAFMCS